MGGDEDDRRKAYNCGIVWGIKGFDLKRGKSPTDYGRGGKGGGVDKSWQCIQTV